MKRHQYITCELGVIIKSESTAKIDPVLAYSKRDI